MSRLLDALAEADRLSLGWQDDQRQEAEQRLGVPAGDSAVIDDPAYCAAMDAVAAVTHALVLVRKAEAVPEGTGDA